MTIYGYARVSTTGQSLVTQKALLKAAGVTRIFSEKVSGVAVRRPELERLLDDLEAGDLLVVTKLAFDPGPAQDGRSDWQGRRWVQISWRAVGGHHDVDRPPDAYDIGWYC